MGLDLLKYVCEDTNIDKAPSKSSPKGKTFNFETINTFEVPIKLQKGPSFGGI
jgi:hypothetical protein